MPGGVCAVLDYEVESMAEYVAEMTTRLAFGHNSADDRFRNFIRQVLSSTRLPSTTILLGMNYLAKRINIMNSNGTKSKFSEGQMWRMLTVALLLGSKFLDDNTFQNRSWSEVSAIPVQELNTMERDWMAAIGWKLYVNLDASGDYQAWLKSWKDWSDSKKRQQAMVARAALVPAIETEVARSRNPQIYSPYSPSTYQQQVAEYERLSRMGRNEQAKQHSYPHHETTWSSYGASQGPWPTAPLTPPDSGYGTPEYMDSATSANAQYNEWFGQQATRHANRAFNDHSYSQQRQYTQAPANSTTYRNRNSANYPAYNVYGNNIWDHNVADCNCFGNCGAPVHQKSQTYFGMAHGFGQPVMG